MHSYEPGVLVQLLLVSWSFLWQLWIPPPATPPWPNFMVNSVDPTLKNLCTLPVHSSISMQAVGLLESVLKPVEHMHWYEPAIIRDSGQSETFYQIGLSLRSSPNCIMTFLVRTTVRSSIKTFVYVNTYLHLKAWIGCKFVSSSASTIIRSFIGFKIFPSTDDLTSDTFGKPWPGVFVHCALSGHVWVRSVHSSSSKH